MNALERIEINKMNLTINKQNAKLKHFEIAFEINTYIAMAERTLNKVEISFKGFEEGKSNTNSLRKDLNGLLEDLKFYKAELQLREEEMQELSVKIKATDILTNTIETIENFLS